MEKIVSDIISGMLNICDGAHDNDGKGFNKFDAKFFRHNLNDCDPDKIISRLLKYKNQIQKMGFDYKYLESLQADKITENKSESKDKKIEIKVVNNELHITTPYNKEFVRDLKSSLKNRRWNGKCWVVPITFNQDAEKAIECVNYAYGTNITIELPKISLGKAEISDKEIIFRTNYDELFIYEIKDIGGRWNPNQKIWTVQIDSINTEKIKNIIEKYHIKFDFEKLHKTISEIGKKKSEMIELSQAVENGEYTQGLYSFQTVGLKWLEETGGRALIADEMGLGKTIQTIAYLKKYAEIRPVLIISPSAVKFNWEMEIKKWCKTDNIEVIKGRKGKISSDSQFYIINYDIIKSRIEELKKLNIKCVVIDESHKIKNYKAQRTTAILELVKTIKHIICLTGTPILSRPSELWTTLQILSPDDNDLANFWTYMKKYANASKNRYGWDMSGAANLEELQERLRSTIMIRRLKKDVLSDLPEKQRSVIHLEIQNKRMYNNVKNDFKTWYKEHEDNIMNEYNTLLVQIEKLKQAAVEAKYNEMMKFIKNTIENKGKVVIFAHHINVQEKVASEIGALRISGGMSSEEKQRIVDEFNNGTRSVVVSMKAGAEGINLQSSSTVIFTEFAWTPGEMAQAEDRVHRIGQKNSVNIYYLIGKNTIDEDIIEMLDKKREIIEKTLDNMILDDSENKNSIIEIANKITK